MSRSLLPRLAAVIAVVSCSLAACAPEKERFDAEAWASWDRVDDTRFELIDPLKRELMGKDQAFVKSKLGEPDRINPEFVAGCENRSVDCVIWGYRIGAAGFLLVEPRGIFIVFHDDRAVTFIAKNF